MRRKVIILAHTARLVQVYGSKQVEVHYTDGSVATVIANLTVDTAHEIAYFGRKERESHGKMCRV